MSSMANYGKLLQGPSLSWGWLIHAKCKGRTYPEHNSLKHSGKIRVWEWPKMTTMADNTVISNKDSFDLIFYR